MILSLIPDHACVYHGEVGEVVVEVAVVVAVVVVVVAADPDAPRFVPPGNRKKDGRWKHADEYEFAGGFGDAGGFRCTVVSVVPSG
jgi:hypothetical protein